MRALSTEGFHNVPEATFRRRLERFPISVQQEVAQRAVELLFIEGDASRSEHLLMDEARAFVSSTWNFQASNRAVTFWRIGQLIQRRASRPGVLGTSAVELWHFLANYDYPKHDHDVEDTAEEFGESIGDRGNSARSSESPSSESSKTDVSSSSGGSGFWGKIWDAITGD